MIGRFTAKYERVYKTECATAIWFLVLQYDMSNRGKYKICFNMYLT